MGETLKTLLLSTEFWKTAIPVLIALAGWLINEKLKRNAERWQMKKQACFKALRVANSVLSNYEYTNTKPGDIMKQQISIEEARACHDELECTLEKSLVLTELKNILFGNPTPASIVDLRNAVRKELGFKRVVDADMEKAFIGKLNCH